jgi:hypothetical protein
MEGEIGWFSVLRQTYERTKSARLIHYSVKLLSFFTVPENAFESLVAIVPSTVPNVLLAALKY